MAFSEKQLTLLLHGIGACAGIVDHDGLDVVVGGVVGVEHGVGDVGDIVSCVTLAGDEYLAALQSEGIHEVLEKAEELRGYFVLVRCCWSPLREAGANRLLNPNHTARTCQLKVDSGEQAPAKMLL